MKDKKQRAVSIERILSIFAWLSLFLAIFTSIVAAFASLSGEENGKEIFGYKMLIVTSDSMSKSSISEDEEIFFDSGDLIFIERIENSVALKEGEVITFISYNPQSYGKTVTHKIREIRYTKENEVSGYVTYGINTGINDITPVKPENIIGKYSFKISKLGNIFAYLKSPRGYYLSVLIPSVLLMIFFSIKVGKILGRKESVILYNQEIENLEKRVVRLENKETNKPERDRKRSIKTCKVPTEKEKMKIDIKYQIKNEDDAFKFMSKGRNVF